MRDPEYDSDVQEQNEEVEDEFDDNQRQQEVQEPTDEVGLIGPEQNED